MDPEERLGVEGRKIRLDPGEVLRLAGGLTRTAGGVLLRIGVLTEGRLDRLRMLGVLGRDRSAELDRVPLDLGGEPGLKLCERLDEELERDGARLAALDGALLAGGAERRIELEDRAGDRDGREEDRDALAGALDADLPADWRAALAARFAREPRWVLAWATPAVFKGTRVDAPKNTPASKRVLIFLSAAMVGLLSSILLLRSGLLVLLSCIPAEDNRPQGPQA